MISKDDFFVGQELYFVPNSRRQAPRYKVVHKVGRKYVSLDDRGELRIDLSEESLLNRRNVETKGYGYEGTFYFSEEEYLESQEIKRISKKIEEKMRRRAVQDIRVLQRILELINLAENKNI